MKPALNLGAWRYLDGADGGPDLILPAEHLVTHGVVVGMTGSGKTGLVTVMIEEAAEAGVPTIAPRWFVVRNTHAASPPILVKPRYAMTFRRGPMTRMEIRRARGVPELDGREAPPSAAPTNGAIKVAGPFATPAPLPAESK
jgi:DNA helicase HerA-like ATPase